MTNQMTPAEARNILWRQGNLSFLLHPGQLEIKQILANLDPSVRELIVLCSRRYGKSYLGITLGLEKCLQKPGARVAIVGPTYVHTQRIILPLLKQHVAVTAPKGLFNHTKSEFMWRFANGSELIISSFEGAVETLRGQYLDLALLEESALASSDHFEYIISSVIFPTLLHSRGRIIHFTTPAVSPEHHFNSVLLPRLEASGHVIKKTVYENPLLTQTDIEEAMNQAGGEQSAHWQREYLCNVILDKSAMVIPEFGDRHVVSNHVMPKGCRYWTSMDMGGVRDFTVWQLMGFDYSLNKVVIVKEAMFEPSTPTHVIVESIRPIEQGYNILSRYVDASGQTLTDLYSLGYQCALPMKMDWIANLELLNAAFHKDEILIDDSCRLLVKTLKRSMFNKSRTDFTRDSEIGHSDSLACSMYGFRMADKTAYKGEVLNRQDYWVPKDYDVDSLTDLARTLNPGIVRKRK